MSVFVALVVLGVLEGALRLCGFGGYPSTFREVGKLPNGSALVFTDHGGPTSYFFANRSLPGSLDVAAFASPKPARTFRVFVVGESAAKGNPYARPLGWASAMRELLARAWPERDVEVINLGTTAVASYPVLGMTTEALSYQPDLVVAYLGNNEFYGAYGVASLHSAGRSPGAIRFVRAAKSLAIAQFVDAKLRPEARGDPNRTLMETMVGQSHIAPDDPARAAAARNLETFVGELVRRCQERGVPVVVCTPPSNERGLAPLGESDTSGLPAEARAEVARLVESAKALMLTNAAGAGEIAAKAAAMAPRHALAHHLLARSLFEQGKFGDAAKEFRLAVDLDPMPWRPPAGSVQAIRRAVAAQQGPGVLLCDLERALREASPGGCTGWEMMDDHVHASLPGQLAIARAVVRSLEQAGGAIAVPAGSAAALDDATLMGILGDNPYDHYAAAWAMRRLASVTFFKTTNPQFYERHDGACRAVEASATPGVLAQLRRWQDPATHATEIRPIGGLVGYALYEEGRSAEAEPCFRVASGAVVPYGSWELEYTYMALLCRRAARPGGADAEIDRAEAARAIERGRTSLALGKSRSGGLELYLGLLHQFRGEYAASMPLLETAHQKLRGDNRLVSDEPLADAYIRAGERDRAAALLEEGIASGGPTGAAYQTIRRRLLNH